MATIAPHAVTKPVPAAVEPSTAVDLTTTCPTCMIEMQPEHAHYKCGSCGYRDSSSF